MTDQPQINGPQLPPDNLVEQAVERAATKVADAATPVRHSALSRVEAVTVFAVLIILNLASLVIGLDVRSDTQGHRRDFGIVCQILVERAPAEEAKDLATRLADCLHDD